MAPSEIDRILAPGEDISSVTDKVSNIVLRPQLHIGWWIGFGIGSALFLIFAVALAGVAQLALGVWGDDIPVVWGFAIANYIWWTDVATGGFLISALFFLTRADWRASIHRVAEAMALFATAAAGFLPIFHLGRYWYFYWLFPYTNTMGTWPQFRSPLHWDFVGLFTLVVGGVLFIYIALIPDLATMRDRASAWWKRVLYGVFALGWQGSSTQWRHFRAIYRVFVGLMVAEAVAAHSIVGLDLAGGMTPGWHSTMLPPYFVAGAAVAGFAFLLMLLIPLRYSYPITTMVMERHIEVLARLLLTSSLLMAYFYWIEAFMPYYGGQPAALWTIRASFFGTYAFAYWAKIAFVAIIPQLLWFRRLRRHGPAVFAIATGALVGLWLEYFLIVIGSLNRDYISSRWFPYVPSLWDYLLVAGTFGVFLFGFFLMLRFVPIVGMFGMRELAHRRDREDRAA
jgi:Ni/Fe-hydrogenase subunit HybB-like protein